MDNPSLPLTHGSTHAVAIHGSVVMTTMKEMTNNGRPNFFPSLSLSISAPISYFYLLSSLHSHNSMTHSID